MEIFLLVVLLIAVVLVITRQKSDLDTLLNRLHELRTELKDVRSEVAELRTIRQQLSDLQKRGPVSPEAASARPETAARPAVAPTPAPPAPVYKPVPDRPATPPVSRPAPPVSVPPVTPPAAPSAARPPLAPPAEVPAPAMAAATAAPASRVSGPAMPPPPVAPPPPPAEPSFWERNIDWEKFVGENLANKLGIAILVLGIGLFVKYAIDKDWINEVGRVAIGILCGGALIGVAHWLRKEYHAFSSVLVGGGMAILFLTVAIAFHEYHLFNQATAFVLMVVLTGFTVFLALAYDRIELAVLGLVGGFISPMLVSTGSGNYVVLFVYVALLDMGILFLAYRKRWRLLNYIAYGFTLVLFGAWMTTRLIPDPAGPYAGALGFATVFYLIFFAMHLGGHLGQKEPFRAADLVLLLSTTLLYFGTGLFLVKAAGWNQLSGLFTALVAAFNLAFAWWLFRKTEVSRELLLALVGLVVTFVSLIAPVQLEGNFITLFWAAEAVMLLWLGQRTNLTLVWLGSLAVLALMAVSLLIDWQQVYQGGRYGQLTPILNRGFITGFVCTAAVALYLFLLRQMPAEQEFGNTGRTTRQISVMVIWGLGALLYLTPLLELVYQVNRATALAGMARNLVYLLYHFVWLLGLMAFLRRQTFANKGTIMMAIAGTGALLYVLGVHPLTLQARNALSTPGYSLWSGYYLHYLMLIAAVVLAVWGMRIMYQLYGKRSRYMKNSYWAAAAFAVFVLTTEMEHLSVLSSSPGATEESLRQMRRIGYPILWSLISFGLMLLGMRYRIKTLRIISLSLFCITLVKLFLIDLRGLGPGGRIASFVLLGVLLLVVSFLYQRLKALLLEDEESVPEVNAPQQG